MFFGIILTKPFRCRRRVGRSFGTAYFSTAMGKRRSELVSDYATAETVEYKTVFVDTNLDTHLAMRASGSETILDIKKKLVLQHMELFPAIGEIKIHSLKIKRRSNFYHLPDSLLLSNAFEGFNGNWYLYVDASSALNYHELVSIDRVKENDADDFRDMVSAVKQMETLPMALPKDAEFHVKKKHKMRQSVDVRNEELNVKATIANSKLDSGKGKEDAMGISNAVLDCSMRSMDATDANKDMKSGGNKRKKEKDSKMPPEILCGETHAEQIQTDLRQKAISLPCVLDAPTVEARELAGGTKKKRKEKHNIKKNINMERGEKSIDAYPENPGIEKSINGSSIDCISQASGKKGSTLHHKGQDVQMNLLDGSNASEKIQVADKNGSDFVVSTQSSQTLDDIASAEKIVEAQIPLGNVHEDFAPVEKDVNMKDADDFRGLSSDVNRLEALPMTMSSNSHEKNHVSSDVTNDQLKDEAKAEISYYNSKKSKEDEVLEDTMPENFVASKSVSKPGEAVPTDSLRVSSNDVPDCNTGLMGANGAAENVISNTTKRKKKRSHKTAAEPQDKTHIGQTVNVENTELHTETHKPEENKEDKTIPLDHNHEVAIPPNKTDLDTAVLNPAHDKSVVAHAVGESAISCGLKKRKKKKRGGNSADCNLEKLGNEQNINGISGSSGLCSSVNHIPETGGKVEDTLLHEEQDVQMKLSDSSTKNASEQFQGADGNEANLVVSTQNSQISENVATADKMVENTQSGQNTEQKDKKSKRRKKVQITALDVTENPPAGVQKASVEVSPTEESMGSPVRSEKERPVGLSSAPSNKSEEKFDEINRTDANTGDLSRTDENEDEGINLKQHQQCPGKDSGNEGKKATKASSKKIEEGVQENALLPTSISTKSFDNKESEDQSCLRRSSRRKPGNSIRKSVQDEGIPGSSRIVSGVEVKDSTPSEMHQTGALQKHGQVHAAPPCPKDLNVSLNKSGLGRSESPGNKRAQTDAAKKIATRTPGKKSLLLKPGTIFQDNSGGSSGDENGILCSASSARHPSDSSALSSDSESVGEGDLGQESKRNGLGDGKNQTTAGRNTSKLGNLSDSGDMTMDMILRSSKRFKHAKLLESQNEGLEPIEFVAESQLD